eukprot:jgi/Galph1/2045/GphlegSOOS_G713.1
MRPNSRQRPEASSSYLEVHSDDKIDASVSGLAGALSAFTKSGAKPKWLKCSLCGYECWPPNARHHLFKCPVLKHSPELRHKVLPNPTPPPPPEESRNLYAREEDNPYYFTRINTAPGYLCNNCGLGLRGAHRPRHLRSCWKRGKLEKSGEKRKIEKSSFSTEEYIDAVGSSDAAKSPGRPKRTNFCGQSPTWLSVVEDIPPTCIHHEKEEIRKLPTLTSVFVLSVGDRWTRREVDDGQLSVDNLCR